MLTTCFTAPTAGVEMGDEYIRAFYIAPQNTSAALGSAQITTRTTAVARLDNTANALNSALEQAGIPAKTRLITAAAYTAVTYKEIILPPVTDISYYLTQNYHRYFSLSLNDTSWDWISLPTKNVTGNRVIVVTCPKQKLQQLCDVATLANKKWHVVEWDILALYRALQALTTRACAAALYLTTQNTCIFLIFSPTSLLEIYSPVAYSENQSSDILLQHIQNCVTTFESHHCKKIAEIIIVGNITTASDLANNIYQATNIATIYGNPLTMIQKNSVPHSSVNITDGPKWTLAYGLSLRGQHEKY